VTSARTLLLSLRPRFAEAILNGRKTIEVRRRPVNAQSGSPVILYASSPVMAVVGTARLAGIELCAAPTAWRKYSHTLGLTRAELDGYLEGIDKAFLLHLKRVNTLNEPLPLRHLQAEGPFRPPQSFRYVADTDPIGLRELVPQSP
jgi:predicted transcriptional regulator